jgi:hypothetical protein
MTSADGAQIERIIVASLLECCHQALKEALRRGPWSRHAQCLTRWSADHDVFVVAP